jgi:eukaryotic-like serine/threonine-protein kinase
MNKPLAPLSIGGYGNSLTASAGERTPVRGCRVALSGLSGFHATDEITGMLRRRLRVAGLIALAGCAAFMIRNLIAPPASLELTTEISLMVVVAVLTFLSALLWSHLRLSIRALRGVELGLFGVMALFFAYLQYEGLHEGQILMWAPPENREQVLELANGNTSLRWVVLIVLYGTFIPNTWKRCATIVGILALTPLLLTFLVCHDCPVMGQHTGPALFRMSVAVSMGAAIAIFGSYKIAELQEEAYAARKLGQYQLRRRLGSGGMGEVYLGEHVLLRRQCAIKLIRPDQAGDPTNLSRFEREVQAMATLTHWNTVEIFDFGHADDGTFYYVMEYLPGMTLQELVERHGPLPPGRAVHFLRQICAALEEAHAVGLIHRDIKPRNVIACRRGGAYDVAKLLDFGLVQDIGLGKDAGKLTVQGTILGSPPFMSPEQALGKNNIDTRTDIYSLGSLAYFLLTGQPPFSRDSAMEMLVAHVHEPPAPLTDLRPELPVDLQDVILRCLQKDPEQRFQDVDSLDRALADCACADQWDRDRAAEWWKDREETPLEMPQEMAV